MAAGETVQLTLERETWEEAGLRLSELDARCRSATCRSAARWPGATWSSAPRCSRLSCHAAFTPENRDGEVAGFACIDAATLEADPPPAGCHTLEAIHAHAMVIRRGALSVIARVQSSPSGGSPRLMRAKAAITGRPAAEDHRSSAAGAAPPGAARDQPGSGQNGRRQAGLVCSDLGQHHRACRSTSVWQDGRPSPVRSGIRSTRTAEGARPSSGAEGGEQEQKAGQWKIASRRARLAERRRRRARCRRRLCRDQRCRGPWPAGKVKVFSDVGSAPVGGASAHLLRCRRRPVGRAPRTASSRLTFLSLSP